MSVLVDQVEIRDSIDLLAPAASTEKEQIVNKVLQKVRPTPFVTHLLTNQMKHRIALVRDVEGVDSRETAWHSRGSWDK